MFPPGFGDRRFFARFPQSSRCGSGPTRRHSENCALARNIQIQHEFGQNGQPQGARRVSAERRARPNANLRIDPTCKIFQFDIYLPTSGDRQVSVMFLAPSELPHTSRLGKGPAQCHSTNCSLGICKFEMHFPPRADAMFPKRLRLGSEPAQFHSGNSPSGWNIQIQPEFGRRGKPHGFHRAPASVPPPRPKDCRRGKGPTPGHP